MALTVGVNNIFDKDPPACFSCSLNNFDPTTYDIPGRFGYARLSYGF
jgi:TonB dependent receptor.